MFTHRTPNLNGESIDNLRKQAEDVAAAADNLIEAIRAAWPQGRDYQTTSNPPACLQRDAMAAAMAVERIELIRDNARVFLARLSRKAARKN